jgi:hypothetical protein
MEEQSHDNERKLSEEEGIEAKLSFERENTVSKVSVYVELNRKPIIILFIFEIVVLDSNYQINYRHMRISNALMHFGMISIVFFQ